MALNGGDATDEDRSREPLSSLRDHVRIVHHVPGRIRVRIHGSLLARTKRQNGESASDVLKAVEGIRSVRVNTAAASAVIEYEPAVIPPQAWETLVQGDDRSALQIIHRYFDSAMA